MPVEIPPVPTPPPEPPVTRPLGGMPVRPGEPLVPGPGGPTTPPLSSRFETFNPPVLPPVPPGMEPMVPNLDVSAMQSALASKTDTVSETVRASQSVQDQERVRGWMKQVTSSPLPASPVQWPDYVNALSSMLDSIPGLTDAPHEDMKKVLLEDHTQNFIPLVDPNASDPKDYSAWAQTVQAKLAEALWTRGVVEEARRVGLSIDSEAAALPLAPSPVRVQALARRVLQKDPNAQVGAPPMLLNLPPEAREGVRPVAAPTLPRRIELLAPEDIKEGVTHAPGPGQFQEDPIGAKVRQQQVLSTLSAGMPFVAGELRAENQSLSPVPISVDSEGRVYATVESDSGPMQVEVSGGMRPAALPAVIKGAKVKWGFRPSRIAPVAMDFDPDSERIVIDRFETYARKPQQDLWHSIQTKAAGKTFIDPRVDPMEFLKQAFEVDLPTSYEAKSLLDNAKALVRKHRAKMPEIQAYARAMAGPNAKQRDIQRAHAQVIQEWLAMGAVTELGRTAAEWRLESVTAQELLEDGDGERTKAEARKAQERSLKLSRPEIMRRFYDGKPNPDLPKPWRRLNAVPKSQSSLLLAQKALAAAVDPIEDWKEPERLEEVEGRLISFWTETVRGRLKSANSGSDWYTDGLRRGIESAKIIFPDMTPTEEQVFKVFLAITSNGRAVHTNYALAVYAMQQYLVTGQAPTLGPHSTPEAVEGWGGIRSRVTSDHMALFNTFLQEAGDEEGAIGLILAPHPEHTGHGAHEFGPKIGAFMLNLMGNYDWPTLDMWIARDFYRVMGLAPTMLNRHTGRIIPDDDVTPPMRRIITSVFPKIVSRLKRTDPEINAASVQAVLWYGIKELYDRAGSPRALGKPVNYGHAGEEHVKEYKSKSLSDQSVLPFAVGEPLPEGAGPDGVRDARLAGLGGRADPRRSGVVTLEHWSDQPDLTEVSPEFAGKGPLHGAERKRGAKNVYFYFGGTPPERGLGPNKYTAIIRAEKLYDLGEDLQGHWNAVSPDVDAFEDNLRSLGYFGYWNSRADGETYSSVVAMLQAVPVSNGKNDVARENIARIVQSPNLELMRVLRLFAEDSGDPLDERPIDISEIDHKLLRDLGKMHEGMPHTPEEPATQASYQALKEHSLGLWALLKQEGYTAEPWAPLGWNHEIAGLVEKISGRTLAQINPRPKISETLHRRMAKIYEDAVDAADDPKVQASYRAMKEDLLHLFLGLQKAGYGFTLSAEPTYAGPEMVGQDVLTNKHLTVWAGGDVPDSSPLAEQVAEVPGWNYNHLFRAVHDILGHVMAGGAFTPDGEVAALGAHAQVSSPEALPALAWETLSQDAWRHFGPEAHKYGTQERPYFPGPQKTGLFPKDVYEAAMKEALQAYRPPAGGSNAQVAYAGHQEGFGRVPATDLWNLRIDIPGHPAGSTVSTSTLLAAGIKPPVAMPYANLSAMREDVRKNKHLYFMPVERVLPPDHPMSEAIATVNTEHGTVVQVNADDLFRAIHFLVGYAAEGNQFDDRGAIKAFLQHSRLVPQAARPALATETIMRHAWHTLADPNLKQTDPAKAYATPLAIVDKVRQAFTEVMPLETLDPNLMFLPPEQVAEMIWQATLDNDGSSTHLLTGKAPEAGFMVGTSPSEKRAFAVPKDNLSPASILTVIVNNIDTLGHPNVYLGTWVDGTGTVWIEPSENVLDADPTVALDLARRRKQQAVWDVLGQKEIPALIGPAQEVREQLRLPMSAELRKHRTKRALAHLVTNQQAAVGLGTAFPELWPTPERPKGDLAGLLFDPTKVPGLRNPGMMDLTGIKVVEPRDVALANMAAENPSFEVSRLHFIDLDDQEIISTVAISSFLPASTAMYPEEFPSGEAYAKNITAAARQFSEARGGHRVGILFHHNHPSGMVEPSEGDRQTHLGLGKALPPDVPLLPSLITDGDKATQFTHTGTADQVLDLGPGGGTIHDTSQAEIPHPALGATVRTPKQVEAAVRKDYEDFTKAVQDPTNFAVVVYVDAQGHVRMIERKYNLREDWSDVHGVSGYVSAQARRIGAYKTFVYTASPEALDPTVALALKSAILSGDIHDVVSGGFDSLRNQFPDNLLALAEENFANLRSPDRANAWRVQEDDPFMRIDPATRAQALAAAASVKGFKGPQGRKLFGVLTEDERFLYVLSRIASPKHPVTSQEHLDRLDPRRWESTKKYPSYFGAWRPTPEEMESLEAAWHARSAQFKESQKINQLIESLIAQERRGKVTSEPVLTIDEALTVDHPTLEKWLEEEPSKFEWWVRQFLPVFDPVRSEIAKTAKGQKRETSLRKLDKLRELTLSMVEGTIYQGPHQNDDDKPSPYNGMVVRMVNARSAKKALGTLLRRMGRPSTVMGGIRQGDHPIDIMDDMKSGRYQRSLLQILWQGDFNAEQATLLDHQQFDLLARAAANSEALDRQIFTAMEYRLWRTPEVFDRPEWQTQPVKVGLKKVTIDLKEWMPKLGKKYEEMIDKAEDSAVFKLAAEAAQYRTDKRWLRPEMQRRELQDANRGYDNGHAFEADDWEQIPSDLLNEVRARLRKENRKPKGLEAHDEVAFINGEAVSLGRESYRSLWTRWQTASKELDRRRERIEAIKGGKMRREGYITHIHRLVAPEVQKSLMDVYSLDYRHVSPEVRNHFLKERPEDLEPYRSWSVSWFLYTRVMNRTIHLEPALIKAKSKLPSLAGAQQPYAVDLIRRLKGADVGFDRIMNQLAFESALRDEDGLDGAIKVATGGKVDMREIARALAEAGKLNTKPWNRVVRSGATWAYLGLLSAIRIPMMNFTEFGFLQWELAKSPVDLPLGVLWQLEGATKSGLSALREFSSFLGHAVGPTPRWYSEATEMGTTESVKSLLEDWRREEGVEPFNRVADVWGSLMKGTEYLLRAHTYYTMKRRALWYGHSEDDARVIAAQQTNNLIGAYSHRDLSPFARGSFWNPWWIFKKFNWAKTEQFATALRFGIARPVGIIGRKLMGMGDTGAQENFNVMRMLAPTYIQPAEAGVGGPPSLLPPESPGGGGGGDIPPTIPPPPSDHPDDEYPDDEEKIVQDVWTPAADYGAGYPVGMRGATRMMMQLAFGLPTALTAAWYIGVLTGLFEGDEDRMWDRMNPTDLSSMGEITALFWVKDVMKVAGPGGLLMKRLVYGLNPREAKELEFREKRLLYYLPMAGRALRTLDQKDREKNQLAKHQQRLFGTGPKAFHPPRQKTAQEEPGAALMLYRLLAGGTGAPAPSAPPGVAPSELPPGVAAPSQAPPPGVAQPEPVPAQ